MSPTTRAPAIFLLAFSLLLLSSFSFAGLLWPSVRLPADPIGAPLITQTKVLMPLQDGRILTYDRASGIAGITYNLQGSVDVPSLSDGNLLITATSNGDIEAIDGEKLTRKWIYPYVAPSGTAVRNTPVRIIGPTGAGMPAGAIPSSVVSANANAPLDVRSMALSGHGVVYAIDQTRVMALDEQTGQMKFIKPLLENASSAGADADYLFVMDGSTLKAFDSYGQALWTLETGALFKTKPVADPVHGRVYVASTTGQIEAIDEKTGHVNWTYAVNGWPMATPLVSGNRVLVGTNDGRLRALDARTGEAVWTLQLGGAVWGSMAMASRGIEHMVLAPTQAPGLAVVDADLGVLRWENQLSDWPLTPAISPQGDYVSIATRERKLQILSLSPMCTIDTPHDNQLIGTYPEIRGRAWAWGGADRVTISMASNHVDITLAPDGTFNYTPDLSSTKEGSLPIQCLATSKDNMLETDAGSVKSTPSLSFELDKENMSITTMSVANPGESLRVFVRNAQGFDLDKLQVDFAGAHLTDASSPFELKAPTSDGNYPVSVSKRGFNSAGMNVGVQTDSRPLMLVGFVLVLIVIGAGYMVYGRKKPVKEPSIPARETVGRKTA